MRADAKGDTGERLLNGTMTEVAGGGGQYFTLSFPETRVETKLFP